jgi:hypothetical protein
MALGPAAGPEVRYERVGRAAFALAHRICADEEVAAAIVERAFAGSGDLPAGAVGDGLLLRRVRELACERRAGGALAASAPPGALAELSREHWRVLDLVALRGAGVCETALRLQLPEEAVLTLLHDGLRLAGGLLSGARQADDHAQPPRLALLR